MCLRIWPEWHVNGARLRAGGEAACGNKQVHTHTPLFPPYPSASEELNLNLYLSLRSIAGIHCVRLLTQVSF